MSDQYYMRLAIDLAKSATGQTSPNPVVGAVVVKNNQIVGIGAHLKAGEPHAEVHAIKMATEKADGAVLYVTLEPCSHFGKTPPCADLVIQSGIKRVVVATRDPNPQVAGRGIEKMRKSGLQVEVGLLKEEAESLNQVFYHYIQSGIPYVTLKTAMSLDGKIATSIGNSRWITSEESREDVHEFRHRHDAILVGINTIIKDNPSLTTRLPGGGKNPIRIILDTRLRIPVKSNVVTDGKAETWIVTGSEINSSKVRELEKKGVKVIPLDSPDIKIPVMLKVIGLKGVTSIFVEGGAEVHGSFLQEKAFQQVITYIAPKIIGGRDAPSSFGGDGIRMMSEAQELEILDMKKIGQDIRIIAIPKEG
ncbi:bifunctional diaminohydroxyphosphoribosylaminopyrimidine deaminase/5-amino-6-(5-phosphoribosylamino)uracil reductase RibD [Bacillus massilinigeriensis]|uniref:bifunctional diaminohydroxyphosphoribosylaminopyrimidine deaminase/5-amino-6-(5-phosphoribosylamino)uracil reductase RibD n=1 Tax=Bacillus massilionigeriensis TaxID=1805475 RepID=UPI000ABEED3D|nr:bifunctional diaminohydroxyphosphoribosylaminopyrimidine deaminase/5-amino-6-(5-phosphoribosylamino)uracil reductase RibD [Bacillus massilionigeriensis]